MPADYRLSTDWGEVPRFPLTYTLVLTTVKKAVLIGIDQQATDSGQRAEDTKSS